MKRVIENGFFGLTSSNEDSEFSVESLLTSSPSDLFKAESGINSVIITGYIQGGCTDILLANTNAIDVDVALSDPCEWFFGDGDDWGDGDAWGNQAISVTDTVTIGESKNVHIRLSAAVTQTVKISITVICTAGERLYIGCLFGGVATDYTKAPGYGLSMQPDDSPSTFIMLKDGSRYYDHINTGQAWSGQIILEHSYAKQFIEDFRECGKAATAVEFTDLDSSEWHVYGYFSDVRRSYDLPNHSVLSFTFVEEI